jgi:hypothetical protein
VGDDHVLLARPLSRLPAGNLPATISFSLGYLWNNPGTVKHLSDRIVATGKAGDVIIYGGGDEAPLSAIPAEGPYLSAHLDAPAGISTGKRRSIAEIQGLVEERLRA